MLYGFMGVKMQGNLMTSTIGPLLPPNDPSRGAPEGAVTVVFMKNFNIWLHGCQNARKFDDEYDGTTFTSERTLQGAPKGAVTVVFMKNFNIWLHGCQSARKFDDESDGTTFISE
jgi:hypothetical protein